MLDTSNYELERPLPKGTIKKVVGLVKYKLGGKFMTEFSALKPKTIEIKKQKAQKSVS